MFKFLSMFSVLFVAISATVVSVNSQTDVQIINVDWSPDGNWMATGDSVGDIKIWDAGTGSVVDTWSGHTQEIMALKWSPDGTKIASGSPDGTVRIWNVTSGQTDRVIQFAQPDGILRAISALDWSPDSTMVAGALESGRVNIWSALTGEVLATYSHGEWVFTVAWHPTNNLIASGSLDGKVLIWDMTNETLNEFAPEQLDPVKSVVWSPDGNNLAIAHGYNGATISVFNYATQDILFQILPTSNDLITLHWSPDGTRIASGSFDGTIRILSALTGEELQVMEVGVFADSIDWSPDGSELVYINSNDTVETIPVSPPTPSPTPTSTPIPGSASGAGL